MAFAFFKPAKRDGDTISGQRFRKGGNGAPVLEAAAAHVECKVVDIVERGDHHIVVGEVTGAAVAKPPSGRADLATLAIWDLGENVFYGG